MSVFPQDTDTQTPSFAILSPTSHVPNLTHMPPSSSSQTRQRQVLIPLTMQRPSQPDHHAQLHDLRGFTMGTTWQVQCYANSSIEADKLQAGIQAELDRVVAQMSPWEADSDISRFNRAAANSWHVLPADFFKVLQHSLFVAEQTQGAYDPCIGHLANLWGFGPKGKITVAPDSNHIKQALQASNWRQLKLNTTDQSVLQTGDLEIDLCSTAKGFGVDQLARYLQQIGIQSYLVEIGGELRGLGCKPDGQPWWANLEQLEGQTEQVEYVVALHGLAIATSGDYQRYFIHDAKRYSHTIDPRNGYPVQHGVTSVTVLHPECMIADALATAMTVLGPEAGMDYATRLHVAARIVVRENDAFHEHLSPTFVAMMNDD
nr:FAD:protein FMN transferase [uncultured Undibacterium sp.]